MLIAQVTDIHLGFEPGNPAEFNRQRLDQVLSALIDGPDRPDLLLATGDLTEHGDADSYRALAQAFARCPFPVHYAMGNHDSRSDFVTIFPETRLVDGFVHYSIPFPDRRILVLDTLEPGRHGGAFCETRAAWLSARLDEDSAIPTLIVMHHPPFEAGIDWMNTHPDEPWVQRFAAAIANRPNIAAILCGHLHRTIAAPWNGTTVAVCASTAPQLALDLRPMDPAVPDDRAMIIADPPAYALHRWSAGGLVTHFETADRHPMLAKFDAKMQPLVQALMQERPA
ncbi:phosphodiesterase [Sphingobium mellinum]|uniref:phosphodiesterase n=1 Tax=Sphingobium mellinum TaxID=1387166 RepID=UPI0030ECC577